MSLLYLASLLIGLILGVIAMLVGVEKQPRRSRDRLGAAGIPFPRESVIAASTAISARFHLPIVAPFAATFGTTGYLFTRYSSLGLGSVIVISIIIGALAAAGAVVVIARWAVPSARRDIPDERYLWQGLPARAIEPIDAEHAGRIDVEVDGTRHAVLALSLTGEQIEPGSDVIIERIEGGRAFVESWTTVERRL